MDLTTQKEKETEIIDRVFFIAGMLGVLVVALCVIWWKVTGKSPIPPVPPCMIHAVTGIYCPDKISGGILYRYLLTSRLYCRFRNLTGSADRSAHGLSGSLMTPVSPSVGNLCPAHHPAPKILFFYMHSVMPFFSSVKFFVPFGGCMRIRVLLILA